MAARYCGATDRPLQRGPARSRCRVVAAAHARETPPAACGSCNASKSNDEVTGWLRRKKLDELAFLVRHYEIGKAMVERFGADAVEA